ncbi:unnamed protein product [Sphagnum tenellum]
MLLEFAHRTEESTSFSGFGSSFRLDFSGISSLLILKRKSSFKVCYLVELEFGLVRGEEGGGGGGGLERSQRWRMGCI